MQASGLIYRDLMFYMSGSTRNLSPSLLIMVQST